MRFICPLSGEELLDCCPFLDFGFCTRKKQYCGAKEVVEDEEEEDE
jgi:hypothetical protein